MVLVKMTPEERAAAFARDDPDFYRWREDVARTNEPVEWPPGMTHRRLSEVSLSELPMYLRWSPSPQPAPAASSPPPAVSPRAAPSLVVNVPPLSAADQQQVAALDAMVDDEEMQMEDVVLPRSSGITLVKQLVTQVAKETIGHDEPGEISAGVFEVECIAAVGRDARNRIFLCVKWQGYPLSAATWELLKNVSQAARDEVVEQWGAIGRITADSEPLASDSGPATKRRKL